MASLRHEIPAVVINLVACAVVHEHLVQKLQLKESVIIRCGHSVRLCPLLRNEGIKNTGIRHLGLNLVSVLDQGHGKCTARLQGICLQLLKDLVVLGLLPVELHVIGGIDRLQIFDEGRKSCLAAAGIAHAVEGCAVRFLDRLCRKFLQGHFLCLLDDGLRILGVNAAGGHARGDAPNCQYCHQSFLHHIFLLL